MYTVLKPSHVVLTMRYVVHGCHTPLRRHQRRFRSGLSGPQQGSYMEVCSVLDWNFSSGQLAQVRDADIHFFSINNNIAWIKPCAECIEPPRSRPPCGRSCPNRGAVLPPRWAQLHLSLEHNDVVENRPKRAKFMAFGLFDLYNRQGKVTTI